MNMADKMGSRMLRWAQHMGGFQAAVWDWLKDLVARREGFEVAEICTLSTSHLQQEDSAFLCEQANSGNPVLIAYENEHWIMVLVYEEDFRTKLGTLQGFISPNLYNLLLRMNDLGVEWVKLDRDGPTHPSLPTFDW